MIFDDMLFLLIENNRSKAYIDKCIKANLLPKEIIYLDITKRKTIEEMKIDPDTNNVINNVFSNRKYYFYDKEKNNESLCEKSFSFSKYATFNYKDDLREILREKNLKYTTVTASSINQPNVIQALSASATRYVLFCGGGILKKEMLSIGKKFIHIHPGDIPSVRGSMAIEWSILLKNKCSATAIFMSEKIDEGEIILKREFEKPHLEEGFIPPLYSSHIRSELLIDLLKQYSKDQFFASYNQNVSDGITYYKMHPVLNEIVFERCN